jgi:hypothetical protein
MATVRKPDLINTPIVHQHEFMHPMGLFSACSALPRVGSFIRLEETSDF